MALLSIGGVAIPTPSELNLGVMDLSKAERNANGFMVIERIATKQKLELKYNFLMGPDLQSLLNKLSPTFYDVTYLDPTTNAFVTKSMYCGDRSVGMVDYINNVPRYSDLTFSLIER